MTREVDGLSDPDTKGSPTTTGGDHRWWKHRNIVAVDGRYRHSLIPIRAQQRSPITKGVTLKRMQSEVQTEMKVEYRFSLLGPDLHLAYIHWRKVE